MCFKKLISTIFISSLLLLKPVSVSFASNYFHEVQPGDSLWKISEFYQVPLTSILEINNLNEFSILYPNQKVNIPLNNLTIHTATKNDTYWTLSQKYSVNFNKLLELNNANSSSHLQIGDKVMISLNQTSSDFMSHIVQRSDSYWTISQKYNVPLNSLLEFNNATNNTSLDVGQVVKVPTKEQLLNLNGSNIKNNIAEYKTYTSYSVKSGDTIWGISEKFMLPPQELIQVNNLSNSSILMIGDILSVPVYNIPIKATPGPQYGELLDWWTEAQYVVPINTYTFEVIDFYTGKSFFARRTTGANHADVEPLTINDTNKMKEIWGGNFSWKSRPTIIKINGRKIAASVSAMPHAGNDNAPGGVFTSWRSGEYEPGINFDYIKNNGAHGHIDIYFLNSTRHVDGRLDLEHQKNVKIAAGLN